MRTRPASFVRVTSTKRSSCSYAGRCWRPRSPCTCSSRGYAGKCWRTAVLAPSSLAVLRADAGAATVLAAVLAATRIMQADAGAPALGESPPEPKM